MSMDTVRLERERDNALRCMRDGWTALRMVREAVEMLGPVGCMVSEEHTSCAVAPTPMAEAEAIIAGIHKIAAAPASPAPAVPESGGLLPVVSALLRITCQSFDNGGESARSLRALAVETAWHLISNHDDPRFEQERRACDADQWAYVRKARIAPAAKEPSR